MQNFELRNAKFLTLTLTATVVRKLITLLVREEEPELAGPPARQLNHSTATGEGRYQLSF